MEPPINNDFSEALLDLETKGYAVVPNVLTPKECEALELGFWEHFGRVAGVRKDVPGTWKRLHSQFPSHGALFQHYVGHIQALWDVRANPRVGAVYEAIWGTPNLTVSFDGCSFGLQPEVTGRGWQRNGWLHLDQSPHRSQKECVQGWVTALDVEKGDGTLTVLEGSHLRHAAFAEHFHLKDDKRFKADWLKLEPEHLRWYMENGCVQRFVECPAGSMVLWDSRTVHSGQAPSKGRANPKNRIVAYVSMLPDALLSKREREKKKNAVLNQRMTTHWAAKHVKLFAKHPRTYGAAFTPPPPPPPPCLCERAARLAGWTTDPASCPFSYER